MRMIFNGNKSSTFLRFIEKYNNFFLIQVRRLLMSFVLFDFSGSSPKQLFCLNLDKNALK